MMLFVLVYLWPAPIEGGALAELCVVRVRVVAVCEA
jgi:hypothetical protein